MVVKSDWKTEEMPAENVQFVLDRILTDEDIELIKQGYLPEQMEEKWFMYYEENKLYIHRSWTGYCVYIVDISDSGTLRVTANRNPEQCKETRDEKDKIMLNILLNNLLNKRSENPRLMKEYLK